jgi:hypothetical protein
LLTDKHLRISSDLDFSAADPAGFKHVWLHRGVVCVALPAFASAAYAHR